MPTKALFSLFYESNKNLQKISNYLDLEGVVNGLLDYYGICQTF